VHVSRMHAVYPCCGAMSFPARGSIRPEPISQSVATHGELFKKRDEPARPLPSKAILERDARVASAFCMLTSSG